tara:strand:+ start:831 stop:1277 length:447 start_codon:yes stop_codon:yes gene_type:complete
MRIFDNILLKQYIDVGAKLKVYANHDWYSIADKSDLSDKIDAIGQDEYGGAHRFSYQSIEQIQVNGQTITLEMLAKKMGDKVDGGEDDAGGGDKPEKGDSGGDEPSGGDSKEDKPEKGPDLSWFSPAYDIGRILMKEKEERKKSGNKI